MTVIYHGLPALIPRLRAAEPPRPSLSVSASQKVRGQSIRALVQVLCVTAQGCLCSLSAPPPIGVWQRTDGQTD